MARDRDREFVEDCAEGRVRESFFMLRERDFVGGGKMKESESEVAESMVEEGAEESLRVRAILGLCTGVSMRREVGGPFLRGMEDEALGVAAGSILEI